MTKQILKAYYFPLTIVIGVWLDLGCTYYTPWREAGQLSVDFLTIGQDVDWWLFRGLCILDIGYFKTQTNVILETGTLMVAWLPTMVFKAPCGLVNPLTKAHQ